jgi:hypothetical protein
MGRDRFGFASWLLSLRCRGARLRVPAFLMMRDHACLGLLDDDLLLDDDDFFLFAGSIFPMGG